MATGLAMEKFPSAGQPQARCSEAPCGRWLTLDVTVESSVGQSWCGRDILKSQLQAVGETVGAYRPFLALYYFEGFV